MDKTYAKEVFSFDEAIAIHRTVSSDEANEVLMKTFIEYEKENRIEFEKIIPTLINLRLEGKLKKLSELDDEMLCDIRYSINPLYKQLAEIFGISLSAVSTIFSRAKITGIPKERLDNWGKYPLKKINMDEFVKNLTI